MKLIHFILLCAIIILCLKVKPAKGNWCNETQIEQKVTMEKYQEEQTIKKTSLACRVKIKSSSSCTKKVYHQKERPVISNITKVIAKCCPGYDLYPDGCKSAIIFHDVLPMTTETTIIDDKEAVTTTVTENILETTPLIITTPISSGVVDDTYSITSTVESTTDEDGTEVPENQQGGETVQQQGINWILWTCVTAAIITFLILIMKVYLKWYTSEKLKKFENQIVVCKIREI